MSFHLEIVIKYIDFVYFLTKNIDKILII
jgi:hypothetical protein